jgi:DNA-binding NtrC family response regulator
MEGELLRIIYQYEGLVAFLLSRDSSLFVDLENGFDLKKYLKEEREKIINSYLLATGGNKLKTARLLKMNRRTLYEKP